MKNILPCLTGIILILSIVDIYVRKRRQILYELRQKLNYYIAFHYRLLLFNEEKRNGNQIERKRIEKVISKAEAFERLICGEKIKNAILIASPSNLFGDIYRDISRWTAASKTINQMGQVWWKRNEEERKNA